MCVQDTKRHLALNKYTVNSLGHTIRVALTPACPCSWECIEPSFEACCFILLCTLASKDTCKGLVTENSLAVSTKALFHFTMRARHLVLHVRRRLWWRGQMIWVGSDGQ